MPVNRDMRRSRWACDMRHALCGLLIAVFGLQGAALAGENTSASSATSPVVALSPVVPMLMRESAHLTAVPTSRLTRIARIVPRSTLRFGFGGNPRLTREQIDRLPPARGGSEWKCLTEALYFEARGESIEGMMAVGEVILNRVRSSAFPNSVCAVVRQGIGNGRYRCQFSYNCDGRPEVITEPRAWERVGKVAKLLLDGTVPHNLTRGATFYHSVKVRPRWARSFTRTARIGDHYFYRNDG